MGGNTQVFTSRWLDLRLPGRWYTDGLTYSLLALQLCATHTLEAT